MCNTFSHTPLFFCKHFANIGSDWVCIFSLAVTTCGVVFMIYSDWSTAAQVKKVQQDLQVNTQVQALDVDASTNTASIGAEG